MGDCHFTQFGLHSSLKEEKFCKFTYAPWCPTCERNSPRRRSRSETIECRRRCREMKSSAPKRIMSHEYENIGEVAFNNDWYPENKDNRIRANLCELPTTYICNNGNKIGMMECLEKSVRTYEQALKLTENLDRSQIIKTTTTPKRFDLRQSHIRDITYDTGTLFDKFADSRNLQEKFDKEIDSIRKHCLRFPADVGPKLTTNKRNSKVSIKTRSKMNVVTSKRIKVKLTPSTSSSDLKDSDFSSSDEAETELTEESEAASITTISSNNESVTSEGDRDLSGWPLRPSLFPHMPPYLSFNDHDSDKPYTLPYGDKLLKWKVTAITPPIVRKTLGNSGFILVRKSNQWLGTWGRHMKSPMFKTLRDMQKLNHFPGTFQIGRKDRLWDNFHKLINLYGHKEFGFLPQTYVLPRDLRLLKHCWETKQSNDMWIIKPPASARGTGIKVINKWSQLPKKQPLVVQKYISNPYLINDSKFDLRLYVLVTSFNPLRIYLYPDGLARFASVKYSELAKDITDRYRHLTNYSINKFSSQYTENADANACQGHKWTIKKLFEFMNKQGVDTKALWRRLQKLVIKTMIAGEAPIHKLCDENMNSRYNCYELFGVDVLLDDKLKAWLLEVNISPSLHSASPLDAHVKGPMVKTLLDLAQFNLPPHFHRIYHESPPCLDPKLYFTNLTSREKDKHAVYEKYEHRYKYLKDVLDDLTGDDVRHLIQAEDEYTVKGQFERIFPTCETYRYFNFMEARYYNRLFDAWENKSGKDREAGIALLKDYCERKVHLETAPRPTLSKNGLNCTNNNLGAGDMNPTVLNTQLVEFIQQVTVEEKTPITDK